MFFGENWGKIIVAIADRGKGKDLQKLKKCLNINKKTGKNRCFSLLFFGAPWHFKSELFLPSESSDSITVLVPSLKLNVNVILSS